MRILNGLSEEDKKCIAEDRDEERFKRFFMQNFNALAQYATRIVKDPQAAEDIVSEIMWKIWRLGTDLMAIRSLEAYLLRALKNACLNYLRSVRTDLEDIDAYTEELMELYTPEQMLISAENLEKIEASIQALPSKTREAFRLVKDERYSYKEAAEHMGISVKTVDRHLQIALERLSKSLLGK